MYNTLYDVIACRVSAHAASRFLEPLSLSLACVLECVSVRVCLCQREGYGLLTTATVTTVIRCCYAVRLFASGGARSCLYVLRACVCGGVSVALCSGCDRHGGDLLGDLCICIPYTVTPCGGVFERRVVETIDIIAHRFHRIRTKTYSPLGGGGGDGNPERMDAKMEREMGVG